jgi:hypothetical protein
MKGASVVTRYRSSFTVKGQGYGESEGSET